MPFSRKMACRTVGIAAGLTAASAATATAAALLTEIDHGAVDLTLTKSAQDELAAHGVNMHIVGQSATDSTLHFPIESGKIDPALTAGALTFKDKVRLENAAGEKATFSEISTDLTTTTTKAVLNGGAALPLYKHDLARLEITPSWNGLTVDNINLQLTPEAAESINAAFDTNFEAGTTILTGKSESKFKVDSNGDGLLAGVLNLLL